MQRFKKTLLAGLFLFLFGGMWSYAQVDIPSQNFPLGVGVFGQWNQATQELIITGGGKIDFSKWNQLKTTLKMTTEPLAKIEITAGIQFPDNASSFFGDVKTAQIIIPNSIDLSNVTNMSNMFYNAKNFNTEKIEWNVPNVITMQQMFYGTKSFNGTVNFTNVNKVQNFTSTFNNSSVKEVSIPGTSAATTMHQMFRRSAVEKVTLTDTSKVSNMAYMFAEAKNFNAEKIEWNVPNVTTMQQMFYGTKNFNGTVNFTNANKLENFISTFHSSSVKEVSIPGTSAATTMQGMFRNSAVEKVELTDTSKVIDMSYMFAGAKQFNAEKIEWNVPNVITMQQMFFETESFSGTVNFTNANKVENFISTFHGSSVKEVSIPGTSAATTMQGMFRNSAVEKVELTDTSKVTDMAYMFSRAKNFNAETIDWDVPKVTTMQEMFFETESFSGTVNFTNANKVENFTSTFHSSSVKEVSIPGTSAATTMQGWTKWKKSKSELANGTI